MRLAFIFHPINTPLCSQSFEFSELHKIFNASLEEADAILRQKGYTFELDKTGKPIGDVGYVWSRDVAWKNKQGGREFSVYRKGDTMYNQLIRESDQRKKTRHK